MRPEHVAAAGVYIDYVLTLSFQRFEANPVVRMLIVVNPLLWLVVYMGVTLVSIRIAGKMYPNLAFLPAAVPIAVSCFNMVSIYVVGG